MLKKDSQFHAKVQFPALRKFLYFQKSFQFSNLLRIYISGSGTITISTISTIMLKKTLSSAQKLNSLLGESFFNFKKSFQLSNLLFISLAVADLLLSALVMPFAIVNDLSGEWMFGKDYCNLWISTDVMCCTASIISLFAISLER